MLTKKNDIAEQEILKFLGESGAIIIHVPMVQIPDRKPLVSVSETLFLFPPNK